MRRLSRPSGIEELAPLIAVEAQVEVLHPAMAGLMLRLCGPQPPMPQGLLNNFTREEILDLLGYLESMGKEKGPNFKPVAEVKQ